MTKYKFPRGQIRIPACASDSLANQTACNRQICRNLLPPPWGGPGRRHSPSCGNLSQQLNRPNTSLAACCPLSSPL
ncbi:hypothetical protein C5A33_11540, partial [Neisseria gonorrhoeae]